jgi:hypothetical protein
MNQSKISNAKNIDINRLFIIFSVIILAAYALYSQIFHAFSLDLSITLDRHHKLMAGESEFYNPWQYRILSHYVLEGFIRLLGVLSIPQYELVAAIGFRFIQNLTIFGLLLLILRHLGIYNIIFYVLALILVSYSFGASSFKSDLSFNLYSDIIFYQLGILAIWQRRYLLLVVTVALGAINRETIGLLPVLALLFSLEKVYFPLQIKDKKLAYTGIAGLVVFFIIYIGLRWYFGSRPYEGMDGLNSPLDYLKYNLTFFTFYFQILGTLSVLPFLTLLFFKKLSHQLKIVFLGIVPVWFIVHLTMSLAVETRRFLVPMVVVFVPATIYLLAHLQGKSEIKL